MNDKKIGPNRLKKEKIVAELVEKVNRAKGMVFTTYQGLTHKQLEGLRKKIQALNADFVATKNTLLKLSLDQTQNLSIRQAQDKSQNDKTLSEFRGATATLFLYGDPISPLKELAKAIKEFNLPAIKSGILEGEALTADQVIKLSTLPSFETLLTQLVVGLKSPISNLHRTLNWNLQKLVLTLSVIQKAKTG